MDSSKIQSERTNAFQSMLTNQAAEEAAIEDAVRRLGPNLMTVTAVLARLVPILWETGVGSDVIKPSPRR